MRKAHEPWINKAEEDLLVCKILLGSDDFPTMAVCFHAQQACEKYLKAFLTSNQIEFPKIHDLVILLEEYCDPINNSFIVLKPKLIGLTEYDTNAIYPGGNFPPTLTKAMEAYEAALQVKDFVTQYL